MRIDAPDRPIIHHEGGQSPELWKLSVPNITSVDHALPQLLGNWTNLVTLLSTKSVVASRQRVVKISPVLMFQIAL
ncbi:hypothetical protein J6590_084783 [Homalodisca vitripennis]|nr:hypothetical protein J6590_084783 [Homalodisca vitripennis]